MRNRGSIDPQNSISPDSALIKIQTPERADFDHRDVRREGICGT